MSHTASDYAQLVAQFPPRPIHNPEEYALAEAVIKPWLGCESDGSITNDQQDYIDAIRTMLREYDRDSDFVDAQVLAWHILERPPVEGEVPNEPNRQSKYCDPFSGYENN